MGQGTSSGLRRGPLTTEDASGMFMRSFQSYESHVYLFCLNHLRITVFFLILIDLSLVKIQLEPARVFTRNGDYRGKLKQEKNKDSVLKILCEILAALEKAGVFHGQSQYTFFFFCPSLFEFEFSIPCKLERLGKYNGSLMDFSNVIILIAAPIYVQTPKSHHNG